MTATTTAWLAERTPVPPRAFSRWKEAPESGEGRVADLVRAGVMALREARSQPGRRRETAFLLLEADGFLTYACEAAAEEDDPARVLEGILLAVAGEDPAP